jgi:hypothetical protein
MNRRKTLAYLAAIGLASLTGCNAGLWGNWGKKQKATGFAAVSNGMNEKQVKKLLGEPKRRRGLRLEGHGAAAVQMTWILHNELVVVTFVGGEVINKQKT